jgi:hypothetical protein
VALRFLKFQLWLSIILNWGIPKSTDLGKRKVCARFVPHALSGDEKHARVEHCKDMVRSAQSDTKFTNSIVTGDAGAAP